MNGIKFFTSEARKTTVDACRFVLCLRTGVIRLGGSLGASFPLGECSTPEQYHAQCIDSDTDYDTDYRSDLRTSRSMGQSS